MNSLHQIELFDTNIDCFGSLNRCQRYFFFFYHQSLATSLSFFSNQKLKNNKNKFLYQN